MKRLNIPTPARYRRRIPAFAGQDVLHSPNVLAFDTATECYNFDHSSGALRDGYGVESDADVMPADAVRMWVYRYYSESRGEAVDQRFFQLANGLLCYHDPVIGRRAYVSGTPYPPVTALNYRLNSKDILLLSCEGHGLITWNGRVLTECEGPQVSSMALHYERLFVTDAKDRTKVFFSANLDPTSWDISADGGGFIELLDERGDLNKAVSFGNYLFVFRDHGISRITAYGDQSEFSAVNLFVSAGRIYPESIAVCGAVIMFLASDGLYAFDGHDCTRVLAGLDGLIAPGGAAAAAYFNGKYYLSCGMNFSGEPVGCERGEHTANGMLVFDISTGAYSVTRGTDISFLGAVTLYGTDRLVCCDGGAGGVVTRCGARLGEPLPKYWRSAESDMGSPDTVKTVRAVYIKTSGPCAVTLSGRGKARTAAVRAGDRRVRMCFAANRFSLAIAASGCGCDISPPTVVYGAHR